MDLSDVADWVAARPRSAEWAVRHFPRPSDTALAVVPLSQRHPDVGD